ncbi:MAG: D-2-hydroxyacid dehydrogenase [Gammaproteobacteria bacterium]|jgi:hypothetical protein|nr:D-2-hydroxyacid dehydrogenase [Gammaproteobacteria bacterium]
MMPRNKNKNSSIRRSLWGKPKQLIVHPVSQPLIRVNHQSKASGSKLSYPVPSLQVINDMIAVIPEGIRKQFQKTVLVGCQHNLETTVTIYQAMKKLGIKKIYSVGKCYSDSEIIKKAMEEEGVCLMPSNKPAKPGKFQEVCRQDIRAMWDRCSKELEDDVETIVVLDDGGRCLEEMPPYIRLNYRVAGIEQTRGGLYSPVLDQLPFPVIEVASSALKREIEPIFIVKAIIKELEEKIDYLSNTFHFDQRTVIGIIGNGAIGSAVAKYFLSLGYTVAVYDENGDAFTDISPKSKLYRMPSREAVISNSQCIFGCTGKDALHGIPLLEIVNKNTVFISCTSEDREFLSTLEVISKQSIIKSDALGDLICLSKNGSDVVFVRGGYPFNFNGKPWNVPANEIEPTQGILLGAVIQAVTCAKKPSGDGFTINRAKRLMLDPSIQQFVIAKWRQTPAATHHSEELLDCFNQPEWIKQNSGGEYCPNDLINQCFSWEAKERKKRLIDLPGDEGQPSLTLPLRSRL